MGLMDKVKAQAGQIAEKAQHGVDKRGKKDGQGLYTWENGKAKKPVIPADYKAPDRLVVVDALPVNGSGKVVKAELRAWLAANPDAVGDRAAGDRAVDGDDRRRPPRQQRARRRDAPRDVVARARRPAHSWRSAICPWKSITRRSPTTRRRAGPVVTATLSPSFEEEFIVDCMARALATAPRPVSPSWILTVAALRAFPQLNAEIQGEDPEWSIWTTTEGLGESLDDVRARFVNLVRPG